MNRTVAWIAAPVVLTHSTLEAPEVDKPHIYCSSFIDARPVYLRDSQLSLEDAQWIKGHMETALGLVNQPKFQNAMQALTSFHCVPYSSICLLIAWSGLEALFGVEQEISFRLSLYIANFLKTGDARQAEFDKLRQSYNARSRVAHGTATKAKDLHEHAMYSRDVLTACLQKCVETSAFPSQALLVF